MTSCHHCISEALRLINFNFTSAMAAFWVISSIENRLSRVLVVAQQCIPQWYWLVLPTLLLYLALVSTLRHQRALYLPKKFNLLSRESFRRMTTDEAQSILKDLTELEFPKTFSVSIGFALYKACSRFFFGFPLLLNPYVSTVEYRLKFSAIDLRYPKHLGSPLRYRPTFEL